jgi:membrane dipeptidase
MYFLDAHSDLLADTSDKREQGLRNNLVRDHLPALLKGNVRGVLAVLWVSPEYAKAPQKRFEQLVPLIQAELAESAAHICLVRSAAELEQAEKTGQPYLILGLESACGFPDGPETLRRMYGLGYRHLGLTWNEENEFATGVGSPNQERGLTELGRQAVLLAEELGMILDVSHLNDKSFWDLTECSTKPFIASHSNARSLCPAARNLTDRQIRAIAGRGGVIGINAWGDFVRTDRQATLDDLIHHIDHIVRLGGIESVGCGFDFCDYFDSDPTAADPGGEVPVVLDFENCTQVPGLGEALEKHGYSPEQIEKIAFRNMRRILLETI